MASQLIEGGLWLPTLLDEGSTGFAQTLHRLNAVNEISAFICRAPKAGNVLGFEALVAVVNTPFAAGMRFSFQGLTSGSPALPDGIIAQSVTMAAGTPAAAGWLNPGDFSAPRAVLRGDILVMVIDNPSFTAGEDIIIANETMSTSAGFPYAITALTTPQPNGFPNFALRYDDGSYGWLHSELWAAKAIGSFTYDALDTPDEVGTTFTPPWPCTLESVAFRGRQVSGAGNTFEIVVYDSDGTSVLLTDTHDWDIVSVANIAYQQTHRLSASIPLAAGLTYRVTVRPTSDTSTMQLYYHEFETLAHMGSVEGGSSMVATARSTVAGVPGAWTTYDNVTNGFRKAHVHLFVNGWNTP